MDFDFINVAPANNEQDKQPGIVGWHVSGVAKSTFGDSDLQFMVVLQKVIDLKKPSKGETDTLRAFRLFKSYSRVIRPFRGHSVV